ncbi:hypothetical protein [Ottowia caeni]|uniref:hypothetical protein n=1 Tax=Ottowia caeni TaxID=2870339 RepID=UPI003D70FC61
MLQGAGVTGEQAFGGLRRKVEHLAIGLYDLGVLQAVLHRAREHAGYQQVRI